MKKWIMVIVAILGFSGAKAIACSCAPPASVAESYAKMSAIYNGKVLEVKREGFGLAVRTRVEKNWKGLSWQDETVVRTAPHSAACGYDFAVGRTYLIYSYINTDGYLSTNICTRTDLLSEAKADIDDLEKITNP